MGVAVGGAVNVSVAVGGLVGVDEGGGVDVGADDGDAASLSEQPDAIKAASIRMSKLT